MPPSLRAVVDEQQSALRHFLDGWATDQENRLAQAFAEMAKATQGPSVAPGLACSLPGAIPTSEISQSTPAVSPVVLPLKAVSSTHKSSLDAVLPGESKQSPGAPDKSPMVAPGDSSSKAGGGVGQLNLGAKHGMMEMFGVVSEVPQSKWRCPLAERVENNPLFQATCSFVIIANAIFLAVSADYYIDHIGEEPNKNLVAIETLFVFLYAAELAVRLLAERLSYFYGEGMCWNWFDLLLVLSGFREVVQSFSATTRGGDNFSYLRAMRLLKMLKFLRIVRLLRNFRELRLVLDSILGSLRSLLWSIILIFAMNFMFGVCFLTAAAEYLADQETSSDAGESMEILDSVRLYWGSMGTSMLSLFQASTGGADWADIAKPLWHVGIHYYAIFCLYIGFFLFVIANSVTSIVVDGMREYSEKDQAAVVSDQLARKEEYKQKISELYKIMDSDGSGEVSFDEFKRHMGDPLAAAFAESLGLEVTDLEQFFGVLSQHGQKAVDVEAFVVGCIKLRGFAKRMDMIDVMMTTKRQGQEQREFVDYCSKQFELLNAKVARSAQSSSEQTEV